MRVDIHRLQLCLPNNLNLERLNRERVNIDVFIMYPQTLRGRSLSTTHLYAHIPQIMHIDGHYSKHTRDTIQYERKKKD